MFPRLKIGANDDENEVSALRRRPVKAVSDSFGHMHAHEAWWHEARRRLAWQPIATYDENDGPVIMRSNHQWALASPHGDGWEKHMEGGGFPLDHFDPIEWAEPTLDDFILLAQE